MFCYMKLLTFIIITARVYSLKGTWPSATTVLIFCIVVAYSVPRHYLNPCWNLYYNYEKYPPLKPRSLALIEQYLPNISDPVYSVHQSFMWFLWLNWRKSTFYPVTAPNDSKWWPIMTSSIQEPTASNCDVTMTDCSRVVAMDAFLAYFVTPVVQHGASLVLLIVPLGTNVSEISIRIQIFSFKKMHLKISSAKWRPFCLALNVLIMNLLGNSVGCRIVVNVLRAVVIKLGYQSQTNLKLNPNETPFDQN